MDEVMQEEEETNSLRILSLADTGMVDGSLSKAIAWMHKQSGDQVWD